MIKLSHSFFSVGFLRTTNPTKYQFKKKNMQLDEKCDNQ